MLEEHPLETLYRSSWSRLYRYAYRLVHDRELAADLVQDAVVRSLPRLLGDDDQPPIPPAMRLRYLYRAVHNHAMNALSRRREHPTDPQLIPLAADDDIAGRLASDDVFRRCFAQLTHEQRSAYLLASEGFKQREIAEVLGISADAAFRRVRAAETALRECWEGMSGDG